MALVAYTNQQNIISDKFRLPGLTEAMGYKIWVVPILSKLL